MKNHKHSKKYTFKNKALNLKKESENLKNQKDCEEKHANNVEDFLVLVKIY